MKTNNNKDYRLIPDFTEVGKIPPQSVELEEAVLGALMLEKDAYVLASAIISEQSFYKDSHQKIYSAIQSLSLKNEPIDILTVTDELRKNETLDEIGGAYYVAQLTSKVASAANIEYHSRIIQQKFIQREIIRVSYEIQVRAYDESIDVADLLDFLNLETNKLLNYTETVKSVEFVEVVKKSIIKLEERQKNYTQGISNGIATGFSDLNKVTGGWQPEDLIIIAGRPSMCKTGIALHSAKTAAKTGKKVTFFSLEMPNYKLSDRLIIGESGVDSRKFRDGNVDSNDWAVIEKSVGKISGYGLYINDEGSLNINKIRSTLIKRKKKQGCDICFIDYLGLMEHNNNEESLNDRIGETCRMLKMIAKELSIPIVILCQLNREVEKRKGCRPNLSDLRDSGKIEEHADIVMFVFRPEYYEIQNCTVNGNIRTGDLHGYGVLDVAKNRNGETASIEFRYNESKTNFWDYSEFDSKQF